MDTKDLVKLIEEDSKEKEKTKWKRTTTKKRKKKMHDEEGFIEDIEFLPEHHEKYDINEVVIRP